LGQSVVSDIREKNLHFNSSRRMFTFSGLRKFKNDMTFPPDFTERAEVEEN